MTTRLTLLLCGVCIAAGCTKEPPPRSVTEFVDNPMLLEAAMVRCAQNRSKTRYEAECVNAREAVNRIQTKEEAARRAELEESSSRKRQALRRTQAAAAEARRRAAEAERRREEAEYLAQFGVTPTADGQAQDAMLEGNLPVAVVPEAVDQPQPVARHTDTLPATDSGNAPLAEVEPQPPASDLESIRDELRRRNEEAEN